MMPQKPLRFVAPLTLVFLGACAHAPEKPEANAPDKVAVQPQPSLSRDEISELDAQVQLLTKSTLLSEDDAASVAGAILMKFMVADKITRGYMIDRWRANGLTEQSLAERTEIYPHIKALVQRATSEDILTRNTAMSEMYRIYSGAEYKDFPSIDIQARYWLEQEMEKAGLKPEDLELYTFGHKVEKANEADGTTTLHFRVSGAGTPAPATPPAAAEAPAAAPGTPPGPQYH